jgi:hypothetical protein
LCRRVMLVGGNVVGSPVSRAPSCGGWGVGVAHCWVLREQARPPCPAVWRGGGWGCLSGAGPRPWSYRRVPCLVPFSVVFLLSLCFKGGAGRAGGGWGVRVGGLVGVGFPWGVCELDSGCEHLGAARDGVASCFLVFVLWCFDAPGRCVARGAARECAPPVWGVCVVALWGCCVPSLLCGWVCK